MGAVERHRSDRCGFGGYGLGGYGLGDAGDLAGWGVAVERMAEGSQEAGILMGGQ